MNQHNTNTTRKYTTLWKKIVKKYVSKEIEIKNKVNAMLVGPVHTLEITDMGMVTL